MSMGIPHDFASSLLSLQRLRRHIFRRALAIASAATAAVAFFAWFFYVGGGHTS